MCYRAVTQHEVSRGYRYDFYLRVRLDTFLFRAVPTAFQASLRRSRCTVMIPIGEDFKGVNDRMMIADHCGLKRDSHMMDFMSTVDDITSMVYIGGKYHNVTWDAEMAQKALLERNATTVLREPILNCILRDSSHCSVSAWQSLSVSARLMPTLLQTHRWLCGIHLRNASTDEPCNEKRRKLVYFKHRRKLEQMFPYDANFTDDPGFCELQHACQSTELPPSLLATADETAADPT
jgi:hypothetical protein